MGLVVSKVLSDSGFVDCGQCGERHGDRYDYLCEACRGAKCCGGIPIFGLARYDDQRFFGGFVDARGVRHDPLRHKQDCSIGFPYGQESEQVVQGNRA